MPELSDMNAAALGAIPADVLQSSRPVLLRGLVRHLSLIHICDQLA